MADLVVSAAAVAVTVTIVSADTAVAAVNSPPLLIAPAAAGVAFQLTATFEVPVTVAPNCSVPPEPTAVGIGLGEVMEIETGKVTVSEAPVKLHPVAPLEATHSEPPIVALPAPTPVTVLPLTAATFALSEEKVPPVKPEGADA